MSTLSEEIKGSLLEGVERSERVLGIGSYGSVYLGTWYGRSVAIKYLHPTVMGLESSNLPTKDYIAFLREHQTLSSLSHPSLVQVYGMAPPLLPRDSHGLVMEWLPVSLRNRYSVKPFLDNDQEIRVALDVCSGVQYLHSKAFLHRDLTTSNIMLAELADGMLSAKITDFGVAHKLRSLTIDSQTLTRTPGADKYMAPETMEATRPEDKAVYGKPADIYSFAVAILSMCIRREPPELYILARKGRGEDIERMDPHHQLKRVVTLSLLDNPDQRPTAKVICDLLAEQLRVNKT